ncbi:MAG: glycosyltransferase family 2 protein [Candidatus Omnitrophica bacterium]|nr:glycosyltransferase family 2 protein [Candidatus Omnitrophota bacterium]
MKLSVLMPVYNEEAWIIESTKRVLTQKVAGITSLEIILVDDGSTDGTRQLLEQIKKDNPKIVQLIFQEKNQGKGACIRSAVSAMSGDICVIQDADLEYDPANYPNLLRPLVEGFADCVYGSRFQGDQPKRVLLFWHYLGNKFLTFLSNVCSNINITDMETGYKAFRCDILKQVPIVSDRFGVEPEITAKIARLKCRMYEVGISYFGRTYAQGKKITWVDGVKAIFSILRFWVFR